MILPRELIQYILKIKYWSFRRRILLYIPRPYTILHYIPRPYTFIHYIPRPYNILQYSFIRNPYYFLSFHESRINLGKFLLVYRVDDDLDIRVVLLKQKNHLNHWETLFFSNIY